MRVRVPISKIKGEKHTNSMAQPHFPMKITNFRGGIPDYPGTPHWHGPKPLDPLGFAHSPPASPSGTPLKMPRCRRVSPVSPPETQWTQQFTKLSEAPT